MYNETFNKETMFNNLIILNVLKKIGGIFFSLDIIFGHGCHFLSVWQAYFQIGESINHRLSNGPTTLSCHDS